MLQKRLACKRTHGESLARGNWNDESAILPEKDTVEEGFDRLKNQFGLHPLAVHGDKTAQNKLFLGFNAEVLAGTLYVRMRGGDLLPPYTLRSFLHTLGRLRRGHVRGKEAIAPTTK